MARMKFTRQQKIVSLMSVALLLSLLFSACGSPQTQQNATQQKADLDQQIAHAQSIDVPDTVLRPILQQENKLSSSHEPISPFASQPVTTYYANLAQSYSTLTVQVKGLIEQSTQQSGYQASQELKNFQSILSVRQNQGFIEAKTFANRLLQTQTQMNKAQTPGQFLQVYQTAQQSTQALDLMGTTNDQLNALSNQIDTLKSSKLDTSALETDKQNDVQLFRKALTPSDFTTIAQHLNAQLQTASALSTLAIPYVGQVKLGQFQNSINQIKSYGGDYASYQKLYDTDKALLDANNFAKFSAQIDKDMQDVRLPLLQLQATHDLNQLMNDAKSWGQSHQYHDSWDGQSYDQAYEYWNGTLYDIQGEIQAAQTVDDYQGILDNIKQQNTLFQQEKADYSDNTPQDQPHQSDLTLMKAFGVSNAKVIVTSLITDETRVYQNGKLLKTIPVVSGVTDKPTPPGFTQITNREAPATFKAFDQNKNSPFYYPDTHINYAMMYHVGEYYYHDSWWRALDDYGLGTKYPHYAPNASNMGTHGCINMTTANAKWLWDFTTSSDPNSPEPIYSIVY
jgi:Uncharacterized protein conserved in bacteria